MIGISLPLDWLITGQGLPESVDTVLSALKDEDVRSIELRTVRSRHNAADILRVAQMLWNRGFFISIHGDVKTVENAIDELFTPIALLLKNLEQPSINITIHPIIGDNVAMLMAIADHIDKNDLPVTISLENNRRMPDKTEGDSVALVQEIVEKVNKPSIRICWDMGHYMYWWLKNYPNEPVALPNKNFLKSVIHTHIHALSGLKTHFPLDTHTLPLKQFLDALSFEYFGLYNLELEYNRYQNEREFLPSLLGSVRKLKAEMPICARLYDNIRDNFDNQFTSVLATLKDTDGTKFGLIHSASYLFNFSGYRWGMDIAFRNARFLASSPEICCDLLRELDLIVISHNHRDHFEESTVRKLAKTGIEWVIPDFMYDEALKCGIPQDQIHIAKEGILLTVGQITLLPFAGRHFRKNTQSGVLEYGYLVTSPNAPSLVFPVDVRDLSLEDLPDIPHADYCFANVWLGDGKALVNDYEPIVTDFSKYMLQFSKKNIVLTHLYENGRKDVDMWQYNHAELIKNKIKSLSPETKIFIPNQGQVLTLE